VLKPQFILNFAAKLVVVLFAGAGGSCTGIEQAIGRHVDIAANHNPTALSCHQRNHPQTRHYREDVRRLDPRELCGNKPVGYLHLSPDCTHFSQAKGGQPRDDEIRSLPWVAMRWAGTVKPDVITLENVKEIQKWGRLIAKRDPKTGRVIKLDGTVAQPGEVTPRRDQFLIPDPKAVGNTWRRYLATFREHGYVAEVRVLRAADFGVPTKRARLFIVARRDGMPIVWPEPTHFERPQRHQAGWVAAHTCIDFSLPSKSIFDRPRPLADATLRRVARGLKKFVLDSGDPFIVPVTHGGSERVQDVRAPLATVTTARCGEFMLAVPTLVQTGYGERGGQAPRSLDIAEPLGTVVAGGAKHALVSAFVAQANAGFAERAGPLPGNDARQPFTTITQRGSQQQPVTAHLARLRNNCDARDMREPLHVISAQGQHHALVEYRLSPEAEAGALRCAAFLMSYYSEGGQWADLRDPASTITTRDRLALVTVWIKGDPYVVVDICLRMLTPRELASAMSFPADYDIERGHDGRRFTKSEQVFMIGNAVPPLLQRVLTAAVYSDEPLPELREAA